jgi:cytochrome oxidase Cu insertion factor (SCO1/SenC/PrrC family)
VKRLLLFPFLLTLTVGLWAQYGPKDGGDLPPADLERIQVGQPAPDFTLPDSAGHSFSLSSLRGKNVVLVFYRGYW